MRPAAPLLATLLAGCAAAPPATGAGLVAARLGQTVSRDGVHITPTVLLEDSRCPADATCVQAGTAWIRVEVRYRRGLGLGLGPAGKLQGGSVGTAMRLGDPLWLGRHVRFVAACPYPLASRPREPSDYRFVFSVSAAESAWDEGRDHCAPEAPRR